MNLYPDCATGKLETVHNFYAETESMRTVGIPTEGIILPDRIGHWYIVDIAYITFENTNSGCFYYIALLEHQTYGDEAGHILAFFDWYYSCWTELTETWDDIQTTAKELCLI